MARRHLRLTAVVALVLVSLTGFSRGHGGHGGHGSRSGSRHHGGGGGCSSSHTRHSSDSAGSSGSSGGSVGSSGSSGDSSGTSGYTGSYGSSGSSAGSRGVRGGSTPTHSAAPDRAARPEAKIVQCVPDDPRHEAATVRVTNRGGARAAYSVTVDFLDRQGASVSLGSARITLAGGASGTVRVTPTTASSDLASCRLRSVG